jgi:hypothetical protein
MHKEPIVRPTGKEIEEWLRERAYQIWEEAGRPEGRESEHWQRALHDAAIHFGVAGDHTSAVPATGDEESKASPS